jgi:uncharacterized iron-regulated membrane protein
LANAAQWVKSQHSLKPNLKTMKMTLRIFIPLFVLAFSAMACDGRSGSSDYSYASEEAQAIPDQTTEARSDGGSGDAVPEKKVIRTARLRMEVADYEEAIRKAKQIINAFEAEITAEEERQYGQQLENQLVIRLAPAKLDSMLNALQGLALQIDSRSVNAEDVTRRYVDLETRLASKRAVIARYQELLAEARNVNEVLAVENNLRQVIEEVESMEAQFRYLKQQVDRSTVYLTLYETSSAGIAQRSFGSKIATAFADGWGLLKNLVLGAITAWPVLILLALLIWWWRRRRAKR